jgi:DNA repair exonuclease SbcCD ATPase subunit
MITFKQLTLRNFLSYGNNTTTIKLDFSKPTLIVGKNYDSIVNGQIDSNGSGKSAILNAISFCLYDKTISNIDKSDVVNYINGKNMELSIIFSKDNVNYKIERYRKNKAKGGDGVRIFINSKAEIFETEHDKTPANVVNANAEIESILDIPFDIFARIVVFTASYEPFLSLPSSHASKANQRDIIEELFGLTELTRKAEKLKELISETKQSLKTASEKNSRIESERNRYESQLQSTIQKVETWEAERKEQNNNIANALKAFLEIDIEYISKILETLDTLDFDYDDIQKKIMNIQSKLDSATDNNRKFKQWEVSKQTKLIDLKNKFEELSKIDVVELNKIAFEIVEIQTKIETNKLLLVPIKEKQTRMLNDIKVIEAELKVLENSECPYCHQTFHDNEMKIKTRRKEYSTLFNEEQLLYESVSNYESILNDLQDDLVPLLKIQIPKNLKTIEADIIRTKSELNILENSNNPFTEQDTFQCDALLLELNTDLMECSGKIKITKASLPSIDISLMGATQWNKSSVAKVESEIDKLSEKLETSTSNKNPYTSIVDELNNTLDNDLEKVDNSIVDELANELEHQDFLLKLLTKKDSFVRKALLNKNIPFLNTRLAYYLDSIGLSHKVKFMEDMSVKISQFGTEYSFENLSAGQKARVNLSLAFAFRDVLQARFSKINFCILDECLDVGLGNVGVQLAAKMIKNVALSENLSMFVISHRDEIASSFSSTLEVEMKNGFSSILKGILSSTNDEDEIE